MLSHKSERGLSVLKSVIRAIVPVLLLSVLLEQVFVEDIVLASDIKGHSLSVFSDHGFSGPERDIDPLNFDIPYRLGSVRHRFKGEGSERTVIHIQDAHCNYDCQIAISEIIGRLNSDYGVEAVNLEGGTGDYDLSVFTGISEPEIRDKVARYFLEQGVINAAEYLASKRPGAIRLWGLERTDLYLESLVLCREVLRAGPDVDRSLAKIWDVVSSLQHRVYNSALLELQRVHAVYRREGMESVEYISRLYSIARENNVDTEEFVHILSFLDVLDREDGLDLKTAGTERDQLVEELASMLSRKAQVDLVRLVEALSSGEISREAFYRALFHKAGDLGMDISAYPHLRDYLEHVSHYEAIDGFSLIKEAERLRAHIKEAVFENGEQRELDRVASGLELIEAVGSLSVSSHEFKAYREKGRPFCIREAELFVNRKAALHGIEDRVAREDAEFLEGILGQMAEFYELTFKRDEVFVENLVPAEVSVLVTGGFHTPNLLRLLRKNGISYVSILPGFSNEEGYRSPYLDRLAGYRGEIGERIYPRGDILSDSIQVPSKLSNASVEMWGRSGIDVFNAEVFLREQIERGRRVKVTVGGAELVTLGDEGEVLSVPLELFLKRVDEDEGEGAIQEGGKRSAGSPRPDDASVLLEHIWSIFTASCRDDVRVASALAAGIRDSEQDITELLRAKGLTNDARVYALLSRLGDPRAVPYLLEEHHLYPDKQAHTFGTIIRIGPDAVPALMVRLRDRSERDRSVICYLIRELGSADIVPELIAMLEDPAISDPTFRGGLLNALAGINADPERSGGLLDREPRLRERLLRIVMYFMENEDAFNAAPHDLGILLHLVVQRKEDILALKTLYRQNGKREDLRKAVLDTLGGKTDPISVGLVLEEFLRSWDRPEELDILENCWSGLKQQAVLGALGRYLRDHPEKEKALMDIMEREVGTSEEVIFFLGSIGMARCIDILANELECSVREEENIDVLIETLAATGEKGRERLLAEYPDLVEAANETMREVLVSYPAGGRNTEDALNSTEDVFRKWLFFIGGEAYPGTEDAPGESPTRERYLAERLLITEKMVGLAGKFSGLPNMSVITGEADLSSMPDEKVLETVRRSVNDMSTSVQVHFEIAALRYIRNRKRVALLKASFEEVGLSHGQAYSEGDFEDAVYGARRKALVERLLGIEPRYMRIFFWPDMMHIILDDYSYGLMEYRQVVRPGEGQVDDYATLTDERRQRFLKSRGMYDPSPKAEIEGVSLSGLLSVERQDTPSDKDRILMHEWVHRFDSGYARVERSREVSRARSDMWKLAFEINRTSGKERKVPAERFTNKAGRVIAHRYHGEVVGSVIDGQWRTWSRGKFFGWLKLLREWDERASKEPFKRIRDPELRSVIENNTFARVGKKLEKAHPVISTIIARKARLLELQGEACSDVALKKANMWTGMYLMGETVKKFHRLEWLADWLAAELEEAIKGKADVRDVAAKREADIAAVSDLAYLRSEPIRVIVVVDGVERVKLDRMEQELNEELAMRGYGSRHNFSPGSRSGRQLWLVEGQREFESAENFRMRVEEQAFFAERYLPESGRERTGAVTVFAPEEMADELRVRFAPRDAVKVVRDAYTDGGRYCYPDAILRYVLARHIYVSLGRNEVSPVSLHAINEILGQMTIKGGLVSSVEELFGESFVLEVKPVDWGRVVMEWKACQRAFAMSL